MIKADLIESIARKAKLSPAQAKAALNAFLKETTGALKKGQSVKLVGFGTFTVTKRKERKGVHPKTGAPVIISARKVVKFKPAPSIEPPRKKSQKLHEAADVNEASDTLSD